MSITGEGTVTLNTTLPDVGKHVTRVGTDDAMVYWINDAALGVRYQAGTNWSSTTSGPVAVPMVTQSLLGAPRNLGDTIIDAERWAVWPHVSANTNLHITMVHLDGSTDALETANHTYASAFAADETVRQIGVMPEGVATFVEAADQASQTLRFFTYPFGSFGATTVDATFSTNPVVANFAAPFGPDAVARVSRNRVYTVDLDGGQARAHFLDVSVDGDTVTFDTVVNSTAGLPSGVTALRWIGSVNGSPADAVATTTLFANATGLNLLMTTANGATPTTAALAAASSVAAGRKKVFPYSATQAFLYVAGESYVAKLNRSTFAVTAEDTGFASDDAAATQFNGTVPVILGTNDVTAVFGTNASNASAFGSRTEMGTAANAVARVGVIQGRPLSTRFYLEEGTAGAQQNVFKYYVTSAPPAPFILPASYTDFASLNGGTDVTSLEILANGDIVGVYNPTNQYGRYNTTTGAFTAWVNWGGDVFGTFGLAPNGRIYGNRGSQLVSWADGEGSVTVEASGTGQNSGCCVLANGNIVWANFDQYVWFYQPGTSTNTRLTNLTDFSGTYGIRQLSNSNVLITDRNNSRVREVSLANSGTIVYSFSTPSGLQPTNLYKYDTDKFLVMFYSGTGNIYALDYSGGAGNEVWTQIAITITGGSPKPAWSVGYGIVIGNDSNLYTASYSGGFAKAVPVP